MPPFANAAVLSRIAVMVLEGNLARPRQRTPHQAREGNAVKADEEALTLAS